MKKKVVVLAILTTVLGLGLVGCNKWTSLSGVQKTAEVKNQKNQESSPNSEKAKAEAANVLENQDPIEMLKVWVAQPQTLMKFKDGNLNMSLSKEAFDDDEFYFLDILTMDKESNVYYFYKPDRSYKLLGKIDDTNRIKINDIKAFYQIESTTDSENLADMAELSLTYSEGKMFLKMTSYKEGKVVEVDPNVLTISEIEYQLADNIDSVYAEIEKEKTDNEKIKESLVDSKWVLQTKNTMYGKKEDVKNSLISIPMLNSDPSEGNNLIEAIILDFTTDKKVLVNGKYEVNYNVKNSRIEFISTETVNVTTTGKILLENDKMVLDDVMVGKDVDNPSDEYIFGDVMTYQKMSIDK